MIAQTAAYNDGTRRRHILRLLCFRLINGNHTFLLGWSLETIHPTRRLSINASINQSINRNTFV